VTTVPDDQPCPHCGRWNNRAVTVDALFFEGDNILLMKRKENPFAGYWALPGGYLEKNQTTTEAALAEAWQEARMRGRNPRLVGIFDKPERHPQQAISIAWAFDSGPGSVPSVGDPKEVEAVAWWPLNGLPPLAFDHAEIIATWLARR